MNAAPAGSNDLFERVRVQLGALRRRQNVYLVQRAVFGAGLATLVALGAVIGLAFVLPPAGFAAASWLAAAGVLAWTVRGLVLARREWLGRDASVEVDRRAGLEARLATFTNVAESRRESRLWPRVVDDNSRLLGAWGPKVLVPRAVPRTVWVFLVLALALAIGIPVWLPGLAPGEGETKFLPREGSSARDAETPGDSPNAPPGENQEPGSANETSLTDITELLSSLPEKMREAILRRSKPVKLATTPPKGARPDGAPRKDQPPPAGAPDDTAPDDTAPAGDAQGNAPQKPEAANDPDLPQKTIPNVPPRSLPSARADGIQALKSSPPKKGAPPPDGLPSSKGPGGSGAGKGSSADTLYGEADTTGTAAAGTFSLDLLGERAEDMEPGEAGDDARPDAALSAEQKLDDAVRRAQVPADYEKIIERLYSRSAPVERR